MSNATATAFAPLRAQPVVWPKKHDVLGVSVSATTYTEVADVVIRAGTTWTHAIVDFCPVDVIVQASADATFRARMNSFDLVCPDGQPVRWFLNYFHGAKLPDCVCGTTSMLMVCGAAAGRRLPIYLHGSTPQTLARLSVRLKAIYPGLLIAGMDSPPFRALSPEEDRAIVEQINNSGAGLVFVGLGAPKQENFVWEHRERIHAVQLCVGAAFDFIAGTKSRAPQWMQRAGLEWLYRLSSEPRRLGERYCKRNTHFLMAVITELVHRRIAVEGKDSVVRVNSESGSGIRR